MLARLSVVLALVYIAGTVLYCAPEASFVVLLLVVVKLLMRPRMAPTKTPGARPEDRAHE